MISVKQKVKRFFKKLKPKQRVRKPLVKEDACPGHSYVKVAGGYVCQHCGETAGRF